MTLTTITCPRCQSSWLYRDEDDELSCHCCGHCVVASLLTLRTKN